MQIENTIFDHEVELIAPTPPTAKRDAVPLYYYLCTYGLQCITSTYLNTIVHITTLLLNHTVGAKCQIPLEIYQILLEFVKCSQKLASISQKLIQICQFNQDHCISVFTPILFLETANLFTTSVCKEHNKKLTGNNRKQRHCYTSPQHEKLRKKTLNSRNLLV